MHAPTDPAALRISARYTPFQLATAKPAIPDSARMAQAGQASEMQAMPALLHYLDVESAAPPGDAGMDCAVAAVYR